MPDFLHRLSRRAAAALLYGALAWAPFGASAAQEPFADEVLGAVMAAEYAVQSGRLAEAAEWYLRAARAADGDAELAERATRIALLTNDQAGAGEALALWRARAPDSLDLRSAQAIWYLRGGRERQARRELQALLASQSPPGWPMVLAALTIGPREPTDALRMLERLVNADALPNELQAWLAFGGLALRLGGQALTEQMLAEVIARFPYEPRVALLRASQLREAGKREEARAVLAEIESTAQISYEMRQAIAAEYDQLGELAAAARVMAIGPQNERTYMLRASLLVRAEDNEALAVLYDELRQQAATPDPTQRLLLGQVAEYLERYEDALQWYTNVPAGDQRLYAQLRSAKVLHDLERGDDAYAALRAMQSDAALNEDLRRAAYLLEAELRQADDDAAGELDVYSRALALEPDDNAVLYARALMWERRDDIPRAEADLRRILAREPENVAALNALGYTLADRTQRYQEALELIDRARVAEPDNAAIIDSYGWVLYRLGRLDEALVELRRAWGLMKDPEVAAHVAQVLWDLGRRDEARQYFERARELDPEHRSLIRALEATGAEV